MNDDGNSTTTRLLTLLNVSASRVNKRKREDTEPAIRTEKLNKRKSVVFRDTINDEARAMITPDVEPLTEVVEIIEPNEEDESKGQ